MNQPKSKRAALVLGSIGLAAIFAFAWQARPAPRLAEFALPQTQVVPLPDQQVPVFESRFASSSFRNFAHASAISALPNGDLLSVWFAGSREGASDVQVRGARFDARTGLWGEEVVLATREETQQGVKRFIRKLGNPVLAVTPDQRLWLFYVSVSIGGWAASSINAMYSDDMGHSWSTPRQLVTSPFLNISTLVRGAPVLHADGSIGLPVYHEFLGKFGEYLHLDADGRVLAKSRISDGRFSLQPTVVPLDQQRAIALMRHTGEDRRVLASRTEDAGRTWSRPEVLEPNNPDSSLAAIATPRHGLLVALNDLKEGRFRLSLYGTDPQLQQWKPLLDLDESPDEDGRPIEESSYRRIVAEHFLKSSGTQAPGRLEEFLSSIDHRFCSKGQCKFTYDYPYVIRGADGRYHLVYSWNHSLIKHISFNDAWLETQL
ncbi:MAG TPA: sialidase family protein [Pseudomonas sp.]|jgi:predicted neuraminidase|nr:sialidase family protein [Pseudomonas sp.]